MELILRKLTVKNNPDQSGTGTGPDASTCIVDIMHVLCVLECTMYMVTRHVIIRDVT